MVFLGNLSAVLQVKVTNGLFRLYTWTERMPGQIVGREKKAMAKYTHSDTRIADGGAAVRIDIIIG